MLLFQPECVDSGSVTCLIAFCYVQCIKFQCSALDRPHLSCLLSHIHSVLCQPLHGWVIVTRQSHLLLFHQYIVELLGISHLKAETTDLLSHLQQHKLADVSPVML